MEKVRLAIEADLSKLPAIEASGDELFKEEGIKNLPTPADPSELASAKCILVVDAPPKGFARIGEIDSNAHLEQLSVGREHIGQGLGRLLMQSAIDWAKDSGYRRMTLVTFKDIAWNAPFYKKYGFSEYDSPSKGLLFLREQEKELGLDDIGERIILYKNLD